MRGNAVMRAKRTKGPSPNAVLTLHVKCEHCKVRGCSEPVRIVRNRGGKTLRDCLTH